MMNWPTLVLDAQGDFLVIDVSHTSALIADRRRS